MSSGKETQEEIVASLNGLSKSQETDTTSIYLSPPNSPHQTKSNISKVQTEFQDELHLSGTISSVLLTPPTSPPRNASNLTLQEERPAESQTQDAKPIVPIEKQIKKGLGKPSSHCIWQTPEGQPCDRGIGGQRVQNCAKTIDAIVKPEVYLDDTHLDYLLEVLETNMYCPDHIDKPHLKKVVPWKSMIIEIRKTTNSELIQLMESGVLADFKGQTRALNTQETGSLSTEKSNNLALPNRGLSTLRNLLSLSSEFNQDPATFWPKAYDTTPFHITRRGNGLTDYDRVRRNLEKPLNKRDLEDGYVYLYGVEGNERFVKIGWTARSVERRHEEWAFNCNRNLKALYPIHPGSAITVPNAQRVEALCHAELHHCRITIRCKGCLTQHIEWFEISPADAIAVIQKWSKWVTTSPYQTRSGVEWTLKEEEMQRAVNIDQFIKEISAAAVSTVASELSVEEVNAEFQSFSIS